MTKCAAPTAQHTSSVGIHHEITGHLGVWCCVYSSWAMTLHLSQCFRFIWSAMKPRTMTNAPTFVQPAERYHVWSCTLFMDGCFTKASTWVFWPWTTVTSCQGWEQQQWCFMLPTWLKKTLKNSTEWPKNDSKAQNALSFVLVWKGVYLTSISPLFWAAWNKKATVLAVAMATRGLDTDKRPCIFSSADFQTWQQHEETHLHDSQQEVAVSLSAVRGWLPQSRRIQTTHCETQ